MHQHRPLAPARWCAPSRSRPPRSPTPTRSWRPKPAPASARTLADITPGDIDTFFFTNGGAEANENAIRIARVVTGRHKILARYRSYHGGTAGAIALTGDPRRWAAEPGIPGVVRAPDFHKWGRARPGAASTSASRELEDVIRYEGAQTIAAFVIEPVVGTNGILVPPDGYMQGVRELCDRHGILLDRRRGDVGLRPDRDAGSRSITGTWCPTS